MSDKEILLTLADCLSVESTRDALGVTDDDIRAALLRACGEKDIPLSAAPVGKGLLTIYIDGASRGNPGPAGAGMVLIKGDRVIEAQCQYLGRATNNQAEYRAFIMALARGRDLAADELEIRSDSELLVRQIKGEYRVKSPDLRELFNQAGKLIKSYKSFRIVHVPREKNREADAMANRAIDEFSS